jgi:hypothetical protein
MVYLSYEVLDMLGLSEEGRRRVKRQACLRQGSSRLARNRIYTPQIEVLIFGKALFSVISLAN